MAFARSGIYPRNLLEGMPSAYRERYFERADGGYRISKTLRQMVIFGEQDLSRSAPFPCIDLVLCRNVLIYFTPELQQYVVNQFAFSLSPHGGYLFLGKAETVRQNHQYYEIANKQWKIYRCTNTALLRQQDMLAQPGRPESRPPRPALRASDRSANELETLSAVGTNQFQRINDVLLRSLPIGVAVVDRSYRLVTINALARRRLGVREAGFEQDFLHAVRGIPYADVRRAIDTVFRERSSVTLPEIELDATGGGTGRFVSLAVVLTQLNRTYRMWP